MPINSISNNVNHNPKQVSDTQKSINPTNSNPQSATGFVQSTADTVNLTGTASQLRSLEQQLVSQPVVDAQRVDAIKREIASGSYEIDAQRVADKMIQIESAISNS